MTDAELIHAVTMYWKTRGTADGPGWWKAISAEMRRRSRADNAEALEPGGFHQEKAA